MKKISVIVPVYNAQNTLNECLDSIVGQTCFSDMEVILVDDCSTDDSFLIASSYEKRFSENVLLVKLDHNSGPGAARNIALSYASGEYIGFVDSDDAIVPTMYEKLYDEAARTGSDFVDSGFYKQLSDEAILYTSDELSGMLDDHKRSELIIHGGYIVTKLFRKAFLLENSSLFREVYMLEDLDFLAELIARAKVISNVKEIFYIYRDSTDSLSKSVDVGRYVTAHSDAMVSLYNRTSVLDNYKGIQDAVEFMTMRLYSYMLNICMNAVYLKEKSPAEIIPIMESLRVLKESIVTRGYENPYVKKGISAKDIMIMKANDTSAEMALALQSIPICD